MDVNAMLGQRITLAKHGLKSPIVYVIIAKSLDEKSGDISLHLMSEEGKVVRRDLEDVTFYGTGWAFGLKPIGEIGEGEEWPP